MRRDLSVLPLWSGVLSIILWQEVVWKKMYGQRPFLEKPGVWAFISFQHPYDRQLLTTGAGKELGSSQDFCHPGSLPLGSRRGRERNQFVPNPCHSWYEPLPAPQLSWPLGVAMSREEGLIEREREAGGWLAPLPSLLAVPPALRMHCPFCFSPRVGW